MDPAVLIFLLYVMIAHDLVCGLIQYRAQAAKQPHKRAALMWRSSLHDFWTSLKHPSSPDSSERLEDSDAHARICHGQWTVSSKSVRSDRLRWKKTCRIVRKA